MPIKVTVVQGDITQTDAEGLVNSANNDLILGSGVSGAILRIGGPEIQDECHKIGTLPLGSVAVTTAGKLKAKWILHAAINPLGMWADAKSIRNAWKGVLREVSTRGLKSVAVPAIGTGSGAFSIDRCADILLEELREFAKAPGGLERLDFVLFDEKSHKAFEERFARKFPELWTELIGTPLPELPPEPEPEPEPPPLPPPRPPMRPRQPERRDQRASIGPPGPRPPQQGQPGPRPPQGGGPPPNERRRRRGRRGRGHGRPGGPPGPRPPQGGPRPPAPPAPPAV